MSTSAVSGRYLGVMARAAVVVAFCAAAAFAQGASIAYVPFLVNVDATVTAALDGYTFSMSVTANEEKTLTVLLGSTSTVLNSDGLRGRLNAPAVTNSRGNITLRLPAQSYQNAEIALHAVNGRRILRGKAAASEAASAISRKNVAAGVYLLSVKGVNRNVFTTRLTHSGGNMNVNVAFGAENAPPERQLAKAAAAGDWKITVSAAAYWYEDSTYTLGLSPGQNSPQEINLAVERFVVDSRDSKVYRKVTIGNQTWMAENLNYATAEGSGCYDNDSNNCAKYGRLYTYQTSMTACPADWHLPTIADWDILLETVGGVAVAGTKLKAANGWSGNGNGTDEFGFAALPGGYGNSGNFNDTGDNGVWWSYGWGQGVCDQWASVAQGMVYNENSVGGGCADIRLSAFSVRCVQGAVGAYSVSFYANGGEGTTPSRQAVSAGSSITLPSGSGLTKSGYTFDGWNTKNDGSGDNYSAGSSYTPDGSITLYAMWIPGELFVDSRDGK